MRRVETKQDKPKGEGLGVRGPQDEVGKGARVRKVREELVDDEGGGGNSTEEVPGRVHQMFGSLLVRSSSQRVRIEERGVVSFWSAFQRRREDEEEGARERARTRGDSKKMRGQEEKLKEKRRKNARATRWKTRGDLLLGFRGS